MSALVTASPKRRSRRETAVGPTRGVAWQRSRREVVPLADNGMRGRVKGLLAGTPLVPEPVVMRSDAPPPDPISVPHAQREALQVLTLAQRTADEHIANAHHQAH